VTRLVTHARVKALDDEEINHVNRENYSDYTNAKRVSRMVVVLERRLEAKAFNWRESRF
jgi:hypothetical protein